MDEALRQLFAPDPADRVERYRSRLLCDGDVEALLELYDEIAASAYGWALALTDSPRAAVGAVRQAFLTAARQPQVFCDQRISDRGWILLEIHHVAWTSGRARDVRRRPVRRLLAVLARAARLARPRPPAGRLRPPVSWQDVP